MEWVLGIIVVCLVWNVWVISGIANDLHQIARDVEWLKNHKNLEEIARSRV